MSWELCDAPPEQRTSPSSLEQAEFRALLQGSQSDFEAFWDREKRWTEITNLHKPPVPNPPASAKSSDSANFPMLRRIPPTDLAFALTPLLIAGGLLRIKQNVAWNRRGSA